MNKIIVDKKFDMVVLDTDHGTKENIKFWQSSTSTTLCSALQQLLDSGNRLGVKLGDKTGIFMCESGDHGNTSIRYGFTLAACEDQDSQGFFHMTGVVQGKDSYEVIQKTLSPRIMEETEFLKKMHSTRSDSL